MVVSNSDVEERLAISWSECLKVATDPPFFLNAEVSTVSFTTEQCPVDETSDWSIGLA